jgi:hypothetical protein
VALKVVLNAACAAKIVPKAGHECKLEKEATYKREEKPTAIRNNLWN